MDEALAWTTRLDGVLNCAGSILLKPAHLTSAEELSHVLTTDLVSAFATVRAAAAVMRKDGGSIVLMSSAAAMIGLPNHDAIAAAKAGVIGTPEDVASAICWLLGPLSTWVTGQAIGVDGGLATLKARSRTSSTR